MKIEVNLEKKYAFAILSVLLLIGVSVFAYTYTSQIPNPGHGADTVWVYANGSEITLQDAINTGKIGGGGSGSSIRGLTLLASDESGSSTITIPPNTFSKILITAEFFYYGHGSVIPTFSVNGAVVKTLGALTTGGGYGVSASDSILINGKQTSNTPVQISYSISGTTVTTSNLRAWGVVNYTEYSANPTSASTTATIGNTCFYECSNPSVCRTDGVATTSWGATLYTCPASTFERGTILNANGVIGVYCCS
jgi:hypothetical protein